jgi:glucose/arabinose dehydrogenase
MAVGPGGKVVIVGTRGNDIWSLTDPDSDRIAEDVRRFAPDLDLDIPHGVDFAADGTLYLAERNRVLAFPDAETLFDSADLIARPVVPQDALIPPSEESSNHTSRVITVGPDDRLYISLGQPYNVTPENKLALFDEIGIGGIIRLNRDGSGREVFTRGETRSARISIPSRESSGSPTTRSTAWATTFLRAKSTGRRRPASISDFPGMAAARCARGPMPGRTYRWTW